MKKSPAITCLFLDIGGVLLNNGWDHHARRRAARHFQIEWTAMEEQHRLNFEILEQDEITLAEYLDRVVFGQKRPFTPAKFKRYMFAQSQPCREMLALVRGLKAGGGLKTVVISNEGRELNAHRIRRFQLDDFVDVFISSSFVSLRKPDAAIFRLALDLAQVPLQKIIFIENTPLFVNVAAGLGIRGILHTDYRSTRSQLASLGLAVDERLQP